MTQADAITAMKTECLLLNDIFTDEQLIYFLTKYQSTDDSNNVIYNIRQSIYSALTSCITTEEQSLSRGGVSVTKADLFSIRKMYGSCGTAELIHYEN